MKRKKFGRTIVWQRLVDIHSHPRSGEDSAYWDWVRTHAERNEDGEFEEHPRANPDVLPDVTEEYQRRRDYYQDLIETVSESLSPMQRKVFIGLKNGFTEEEIAGQLNLSRSRVRNLREQLKNKFTEGGQNPLNE